MTQWEVLVVNTGDHLARLADRDLLAVGGGFAGATAGSSIIATGYESWVPVTFASVPSRGGGGSARDELPDDPFAQGLLVVDAVHPMGAVVLDRAQRRS